MAAADRDEARASSLPPPSRFGRHGQHPLEDQLSGARPLTRPTVMMQATVTDRDEAPPSSALAILAMHRPLSFSYAVVGAFVHARALTRCRRRCVASCVRTCNRPRRRRRPPQIVMRSEASLPLRHRDARRHEHELGEGPSFSYAVVTALVHARALTRHHRVADSAAGSRQ